MHYKYTYKAIKTIKLLLKIPLFYFSKTLIHNAFTRIDKISSISNRMLK